jgi:hypothetical protein
MSNTKTYILAATSCALWFAGCRQSVSLETELKTAEAASNTTVESTNTEASSEDTELAGTEHNSLARKDTAYFSILLPTNWTIAECAPEEGEDGVSFDVKDSEGTEVFNVSVATDEPRFIQCFCAPWEKYKKYEKDGIKYADLTFDIGLKSVRTMKAVGAKYGTDVHLAYENYDHKLLDKIVESIRPL